jgi:hypothetical protein
MQTRKMQRQLQLGVHGSSSKEEIVLQYLVVFI